MSQDQRYLALWQRMSLVVQAHSEEGRTQDADYCISNFFLCFDDINELERHIAIAEEALRQANHPI